MRIGHVPVSVIVVNWNGRHLLDDCLRSLQQQSFGDFEVILVDNGSTDGSAQWVTTHYPETRVLCLGRNYGFSEGNNAGVREARGEYIVLLNNDTEVEPDWLKELYEHISDDDRIAACDSKVLFHASPGIIWSVGGNYSIAGTVSHRALGRKDGPEFSQPTEVFTAIACSAIYRRSLFQGMGFLDRDFFAGYEDVDWSFRAHLCGHRILNVPTSRVYHKVSATHRYNSATYVYHGQRNVVAVFIKNMPAQLLWRYWPLHFVYTLGGAVYFSKIGRANAFLKAKWEALYDLPRLLAKRKEIQRLRMVSANDIDAMLSRDWYRALLRKARN
jgi:GT2 family glycosyltransferase